ncbi:hypothetical protein, variant 1 [Aphanomyces invadans]|uniref:Rho-GAP domain-containing protein n=1 Tax=Aphanomyces invadans TaxID=157072 RepID=A0A024TMX7_9STRA|nr:hypothetical protein, variant 1 [Aphanomyces invadans]ETV94717.1 hypothetical protein, variant 1 [Aphanomyces invadans]|eukprot:XP_008876661.1 hypothetical protein, variant 1 [Aphanomyces invadans]
MFNRLAAWLVPSAGPDDEHAKKRYDILAQLKKAVMEVCNWYEEKNKLEFQGKRPLEEEDIGMHDLLWSIQSCLQHGLREGATTSPTSTWLLLHFIKSTLTSSDPSASIPMIGQVIDEAAKESSTDAGRIRCWIRQALNQSLVDATLALALLPSNEQFLCATYEDTALLRCQEATTIMLQLLSYVKELTFKLHVTDREFSRRRTSLPNLSSMSGPSALTATPATSTESRVDVLIEKVEALVDDVAAQADEFMSMRARALSDRKKGIKPWQHVFNVELSFLVKNPYHTRHAFIHPYLAVPNFLVECLDYLKVHAGTPRLFRTTVSQVYVSPVKDYIEANGKFPAHVDAHVASAVVLEFLRHIPEPLITSDRYDAFIASSRMANEADGVRNLTCLVADLPVEYKVTMEVVFGALAEILAHADENGLNVVALSIALAPAIVRKRETRENKSQMQAQEVRMAAIGAHVVELLLLHHTVVFQPVRDQIVKAKEEFQAKQAFLEMFPAMLKQPVRTDDADMMSIWTTLAAHQRQLEQEALQLDQPSMGSTTDGCKSHVDACNDWLVEDAALWQRFGFREGTALANFNVGGQLLLQCVAFFLRTDPTGCQLLAERVNEYNMGEAFAALVLVLLNVLKLAPTPDQPSLDFTLLSMEPFWEIFADPSFFHKLFALSVRVFDYNWTMSPRPEFGRILEETEAQMTWLVQRSPSSVEDLVDDWMLYRQQAATKATAEQTAKETITMETKLLGKSAILSDAFVAELDQVLPITCQLCQWKLLFSNDVHGSSLLSLLTLCKGQVLCGGWPC